MATISDYNKYAQLATAAYVRMGVEPLTGQRFAEVAREQFRLPLSIAEYLFDPDNEYGAPVWTVAHYFGGDMPEYDDNSGFAATLFKKGGDNVLAIRGVEPTVTIQDGVRDLVGASVGGIGLLGVALNQVVDMVNLIQRLYGSGMVTQIRAELSLTRPEGPDANFVELASTVPFVPLYLTLHTFEAMGHDALEAGEKITVTGHSLGGHLAIVAARLFSDRINPDVYVFNSAGFDPVSVNLASATVALSPILGTAALGLIVGAKAALSESLGAEALLLADGSQQMSAGIIGMIRNVLGSQPSAITVHNLESEDSAPGNDVSVVASIFTGAGNLGQTHAVATEVNSHAIEQMMDALALQAAFYRLDQTLDLQTLKLLVYAASGEAEQSEERLTEALHALLVQDSPFTEPGTQLPPSDASAGPDLWTGKGEISARDAFHDAILQVLAVIDEPGTYSISSLVSLPADIIASIARAPTEDNTDQAYRYALFALNPFAVIGADYTAHNEHGELDLYQPATRSGTLTQAWVEDRAAFLAARNKMYTHDREFALLAYGTQPWHYRDLALDQSVPVAVPVLGFCGQTGQAWYIA